MAERLIDAEAFGELLINRMNTIAKEQLERCPADVGIAMGVVLGIKDLLDSQSTIEAKPVAHAHWNQIANGFMVCSRCEEIVEENRKYSFCPICGAQMDSSEVKDE